MSDTKRFIALTGFMGAGKTTLARAVGELLDCQAVDLDDLIQQQHGRTPTEIIEQEGEECFREIETELLVEVLKDGPARVLALGGGTWTITENRLRLAAQEVFTVWLDAPFELCWKRIEASAGARPLASSRAVAAKRFEDRLRVYQLADARIVIEENERVDEIASRIVALVSPD